MPNRPLARCRPAAFRAWLAAGPIAAALLLAGCASPEPANEPAPMRPAEARALIARLLPANVTERSGWATDIYAAFASMNIAPTPPNACAVIAVTDQESNFRADPSVPGLGALAWKEIDARADRVGVPQLVVHAALGLTSPTGKSYGQRIDAARTERELSDIFEDFIAMVPMGRRLFASWNPVRTGGPMQVSVAFAEKHARQRAYPYPLGTGHGDVRHEVFTRRGGMYFGIAHLLDYPAGYGAMLYRFADFNAGHYASRNAALQNAISVASGIPLELDGDLVRFDGDADAPPGSTEVAARALAGRLRMSPQEIRRDLDKGSLPGLERSVLHERVFALADQIERKRLPREVLPGIELKSPKITRKLTTDWFAQRVDERFKRCLARAAAPVARS